MKKRLLCFVLAFAMFCALPLAAQAGVAGTYVDEVEVSGSGKVDSYTAGGTSSPTNAVFAVTLDSSVTPPHYHSLIFSPANDTSKYVIVTLNHGVPPRREGTIFLAYGHQALEGRPIAISAADNGEFVLRGLGYTDAEGLNWTYLGMDYIGNTAGLDALPDEFADVSFTLDLPVDSTGPTLTGLTLPGAAITAGASLSAYFTATDDASGVDFGAITFQHTDGHTVREIFQNNAIGAAREPSPHLWADGEYSVTKVELADAAGNVSTYEGAGLAGITGADAKLTIDLVPDPVITVGAQPAVATVTEGLIGGSLSVSASVTQNKTLTYKWYQNAADSTTGGTEVGGNSAALAIPTGLEAGDYYFYCVLSADGAANVTSATAKVTVQPPAGEVLVPNGTHLDVEIATSGDKTAMEGLVSTAKVAGELVQTLDIQLFDAADTPIDGLCTIRVNIPGLAAADTVKIIHELNGGGSETISAISHDGYAVFQVSTFSLFGIVVQKYVAPPQKPPAAVVTAGTTPDSPQTGVYN